MVGPVEGGQAARGQRRHDFVGESQMVQYRHRGSWREPVANVGEDLGRVRLEHQQRPRPAQVIERAEGVDHAQSHAHRVHAERGAGHVDDRHRALEHEGDVGAFAQQLHRAFGDDGRARYDVDNLPGGRGRGQRHEVVDDRLVEFVERASALVEFVVARHVDQFARTRVTPRTQAHQRGVAHDFTRANGHEIGPARSEPHDANDGAHLYVAELGVTRALGSGTCDGAGADGAKTCGPVVLRPHRPKAGSTWTAAA